MNRLPLHRRIRASLKAQGGERKIAKKDRKFMLEENMAPRRADDLEATDITEPIHLPKNRDKPKNK